jgi:glutathione S-transferase
MLRRVKLLDNAFSPYAFKVRAFLYEKGIVCDMPGLRTERERGELRRHNSRDEVPTLLDGDIAISDSTIICEYLEERYPSPRLLPADHAHRARCRGIEAFADGDLDACVFVMGILALDDVARKRHGDVFERAAAVHHQHRARLDAELQGKQFFTSELSLADIAVYPHLRGAAYLGLPIGEDHSHLHAWMATMGERQSIRQATRDMAKAFHEFRTDPEPFFARGRVHWRSERLEWGVRLGLGPWILDEIDAGRAFFSPS